MRKTTKYDLEFRPARKRRMEMVWRFVAGIFSIALLLAVVSVLALQKDGLIDRLIGTYFDRTEPTEPEDPDAWKHTGSAVFLLSGTGNQKQELRFVFLVRADIAQRKIHIHPLSPTAKAPDGDGDITLEQAQKDGGAKGLKTAVEALTETAVDRYITGTDDGFARAVTIMGAVSIENPARIDYRESSFSITLAQGTQSLQGDMLLRYMRYLGTRPDGQKMQGEVLGRMLETYLVPANADSPETLERRFNSLVNILQTDITAKEFQAQQILLQALLQSGEQIKFDVREGEAIH